VTIAPRSRSSFINSSFDTPYSCTATRAPRIGHSPDLASIAANTSRHVFGSTAIAQTGTRSSRTEAAGPTHDDLRLESAAMTASRG
jgi:hypothetical protein